MQFMSKKVINLNNLRYKVEQEVANQEDSKIMKRSKRHCHSFIYSKDKRKRKKKIRIRNFLNNLE